jgi:hypothetical protein
MLKALFDDYLVPMVLQLNNLEDMRRYFQKEKFAIGTLAKIFFGLDKVKTQGE